MKRAIFVLMSAALAAPAQEAAKPQSPARQAGVEYTQQVYQVQHADVQELVRLVASSPGQGQTPVVRSSQNLRAITVYGTRTEVGSIMWNLKALDVPGRAASPASKNSFELTSYILLGAAEGGLEGSPLPDSLKGVATELERTFGLRQIRLLEAGVLRVGARTQNRLFGAAGSLGHYQMQVADAVIDGSVVRIGRILFEATIGEKGPALQMHSSADLTQGQQLVVGKANIAGTGQSLIQVVSIRLN